MRLIQTTSRTETTTESTRIKPRAFRSFLALLAISLTLPLLAPQSAHAQQLATGGRAPYVNVKNVGMQRAVEIIHNAGGGTIGSVPKIVES